MVIGNLNYDNIVCLHVFIQLNDFIIINKKINLFIFNDTNQAQESPDLSSPVLSRYKESQPEKVVLLNSYVKAAQGFWGKKIKKPEYLGI